VIPGYGVDKTLSQKKKKRKKEKGGGAIKYFH
jgi:hypothetical protein